jgi:sugar lactone lactonase YvrE
MGSIEVLADGFYLPECPRWHNERLFIVDIFGHLVLRIGDDGSQDVVHRFGSDQDVGGIGWLPDGRLLVVEQLGRIIYSIGDGETTVYADLSQYQPYPLNDMIVAHDGTAYVSGFGWDVWGGGSFAESSLFRIGTDRSVTEAAPNMKAPNGMALDERGETLYVAEPGGARLQKFRISRSGSLHDQQVITPKVDGGTPSVIPDGICLDDAGGIWMADPVNSRVVRTDIDGLANVVIPIEFGHPLACVLGGSDRRTLFVTVSDITSKSELTATPGGSVLRMQVDRTGTGRP